MVHVAYSRSWSFRCCPAFHASQRYFRAKDHEPADAGMAYLLVVVRTPPFSTSAEIFSREQVRRRQRSQVPGSSQSGPDFTSRLVRRGRIASGASDDFGTLQSGSVDVQYSGSAATRIQESKNNFCRLSI